MYADQFTESHLTVKLFASALLQGTWASLGESRESSVPCNCGNINSYDSVIVTHNSVAIWKTLLWEHASAGVWHTLTTAVPSLHQTGNNWPKSDGDLTVCFYAKTRVPHLPTTFPPSEKAKQTKKPTGRKLTKCLGYTCVCLRLQSVVHLSGHFAGLLIQILVLRLLKKYSTGLVQIIL